MPSESAAKNDHCRGCANGGDHDSWCPKASAAKDYRASDDPNWQPWTTNDGQVVTLLPEHCDAIYQALVVYKRVCEKERSQPTFDVDAAIGIVSILRSKSCLMGRLLYDGKAPLVDAPPLVMAAPDYSLEVPR